MSTVSPERDAHPGAELVMGDPGFLDSAAWETLSAAADSDEFAKAWLDLQCRLIGDVQIAVLVRRTWPDGTTEGQLLPRGWWTPQSGSSLQQPEGVRVDAALTAVAELAIERSRGAVRRVGGSVEPGAGDTGMQTAARDLFAWPLAAGDQVDGVIALEALHRDDRRMRLVMRLLQWGAAWWQPRRPGSDSTTDRAASREVLGVLVNAMEESRLEAAATAAVTELAVALRCDRVAYGSTGGQGGRGARVRALSHSAEFNKKSSLIRDIEAAMDEAVDQQAMLVLPGSSTAVGAQGLASHAARRLADKHGAGALCIVPLTDAGRLTGAISLERGADAPFSAADQALCQHVAVLLGPVLEAKRREQRWIGAKNWDALVALLGRLLGPGHLLLKTGTLAVGLLIAVLTFATGEYRLNGPAVLEGRVQRALTAPLDGFIASAAVRPGDIVSAGEVLAALEDKDLQLEQAKWEAELAKLAREYSQAISERDRAEMRVLGARIDQAEARAALVAEQLARTALVAPFDGVVVAGDLSQSIGAPVSRGDILFELAPLKDYRVVLKMDERDIADVHLGQRGRVALSGLPARPLPIEVVKLTPVAEVEEGSNRFRVEARLLDRAASADAAPRGDDPPGSMRPSTEPPALQRDHSAAETPRSRLPEPVERNQSTPQQTLALLRPGMRGIGKLDAGERNLFWIWTHRLQHWVRTQWWAWNG